MGIHTISSREFNQNTGLAKRLTEQGIVVITDRGESAHVLMSYQDYLRLTQAKPATLAELIAQEEPQLEFEPPRLGDKGEVFKEVDLS